MRQIIQESRLQGVKDPSDHHLFDSDGTTGNDFAANFRVDQRRNGRGRCVFDDVKENVTFDMSRLASNMVQIKDDSGYNGWIEAHSSVFISG